MVAVLMQVLDMRDHLVACALDLDALRDAPEQQPLLRILGTEIQATVVAWQVYALTKDPLSLGLVGLAEALPFIGAALYAGHIADTFG